MAPGMQRCKQPAHARQLSLGRSLDQVSATRHPSEECTPAPWRYGTDKAQWGWLELNYQYNVNCVSVDVMHIDDHRCMCKRGNSHSNKMLLPAVSWRISSEFGAIITATQETPSSLFSIVALRNTGTLIIRPEVRCLQQRNCSINGSLAILANLSILGWEDP